MRPIELHLSFQEGNKGMFCIVRIEGTAPIIHHSANGIDPLHPINIEKAEITSKRGSNRTEADDERLRQLETTGSLWLDAHGRPAIPSPAIRAVIETGARKRRQGPQVREGLTVVETSFHYDVGVYGESLEELAKTAQFTVPVVVGRIRLLRTRAKFDPPWHCTFTADVDDELVSREQLERWLEIGGRRIGLGDWRPEKSGQYGRFRVTSIEAEE